MSAKHSCTRSRGTRLALAALFLFWVFSGSGCLGSRQGRLASDDVAGWLDRARASSAEDRHLDAANAYERVLAVDYGSLQAHRGLAQAYFNLGRLGELEAGYRQRLESEPTNPFHAYGLAITAYASSAGRADEAIELLLRAEEMRPALADMPYRRGVMLLDAERFEEAREAFARSVEIEDSARARAPLALTLYNLGRVEESLEILRGLLELGPSPREVELAKQVAERISDPFRGFPIGARGRFERAIGWLQQADVPHNAIDILREILLEYPEAAMVHAILGLAYQRLDAGGEAMVHLRRAIELSPDMAMTHFYLAGFLESRERYEEARASYLAALNRNPLLIEAHAALGLSAADRGDSTEAVRHLRAWALLTPTRTQPKLLLSRSLAAVGDLEGARVVLEEVLALDESSLEAHMSLGAIYVRRHATASSEAERAASARAAKRHLEQVLEVQPDNPAARRLMAEIK